MRSFLGCSFIFAVTSVVSPCDAQLRNGDSEGAPVAIATEPASVATTPPEAPDPLTGPMPERPPLTPKDSAMFMEAAKTAWGFLERNYQPATGLISPTADYHIITTWDVGSVLGGTYAAHELGLIDDAEYDKRMGRLLQTLQEVPLFLGTAYNRSYMTKQIAAVDRNDKPSQKGYAWNITDIGRLLVWLKIIAAQEPQYASAAQKVVDRVDYPKIVSNGYMFSEMIASSNPKKTFRYQEGRVGYEQYAATGFALWGHAPKRALDWVKNSKVVEVMGQPIRVDTRGYNRVTSEPYVLLGLEVGWTPEIRKQAEAVLAAQEARYKQTGQITIVSEDAIAAPPHYFYYYLVYGEDGPFVIEVQRPDVKVDGPRTVSTKAAFAWYALLPNEYTRKALEHVQVGKKERGWSSGVFEGTGRPTGSENINTSAVVLESVLYIMKGGPLLKPQAASASS